MADDPNSLTQPYIILADRRNTFFELYLSDTIATDDLEYADLFDFLRYRNTNDVVQVYLSCFGGCVHTGLKIAHALHNTKAKTKIVMIGPSYSMGSIIALAADEFEMAPKSFLMFHNYSSTEDGKAAEMAAGFEHYRRYFKESLEFFCSPFLTNKEISTILKDIDVYVHESDKGLADRVERHFSPGEESCSDT